MTTTKRTIDRLEFIKTEGDPDMHDVATYKDVLIHCISSYSWLGNDYGIDHEWLQDSINLWQFISEQLEFWEVKDLEELFENTEFVGEVPARYE